MAKHVMIFDQRRCVGCNACVVACQINYDMPPENKLNWVSVEESGTFPDIKLEFIPQLCGHCDNAPCIDVCPVSMATFRTTEGYVLVDEEACIGCGACVAACPYGARSMNGETAKAVKCTYCADRVEAGEQPVCSNTCPTNARIFGDAEDPSSEVSKILAEMNPIRYDAIFGNEDDDLQPNVYYI